MSDKPEDTDSAQHNQPSLLRTQTDTVRAEAPDRHIDELLHELHVHQIELEMQNDELRRAQLSLEESRDRYFELYEFASVGYLTLSRDGMIAESNLTAASLLGVERKKFLQRRFSNFVPVEERERWHRHFVGMLQCDERQCCELPLQRSDGSSIYVQLDGRCVKAGGMVRIALTDLTERKRIEIELREYQKMLRELAVQDVASREAGYKHIAREMHDELGQILTALRMDISLLRIQFGERDPMLMKKIQDVLVLVDKAIQGVRDVAVNLRPPALDMGVVPAIAWLCNEFLNRTATACTLRVVDDPVDLDDERTVVIFRIVQESLTNVARYAAASNAEITIRQCGEEVEVEVRDDGRGFDPAVTRVKKSFGLLGMRERAISVGGKVEIDSAPGQGTVVSVRIPIRQASLGRRAND